jgi:tagatose 1,6-diphosphate aldolase GatY/KbaY
VIAGFRELLEERRAAGAAAGAFTCYTVTTAIGVVRAAEHAEAPVILLVSEASYAAAGGHLLLQAIRAVAERAPVPVCVQLDHVADLTAIADAVEDGAGAVMADGSRLSYAENAALVREAAMLAAPAGAGVEAELGHLEGDEDVAATTAAGALTDPEEAGRFAAETDVDCLAVSIGNVHGRYAAPPTLDWERLQRIRERVEVPLSLHGASGLLDDDLRRAVASGICKVNVNTELRERVFAELERHVPAAAPGLRLLDLEIALVDAVAEVAKQKLRLLAGGAVRSVTTNERGEAR